MEYDITHRPSDSLLTVSLAAGEEIQAEGGAMVSHDASVEMETNATGGFLKSIRRSFGGSRSFFGGEGLFLLKIAGSGPAFLSSYGAIEEVDVGAADPFVVDTGHIVAFEDSVDFAVRRVGGLKSTVLSGEGLVCEFRGDGKVWLQTRSADAFLSWLLPKLPRPPSTGQ